MKNKYEVIETFFFGNQKILALVDTEKQEAVCSFYINGSYKETLENAKVVCDRLNKSIEDRPLMLYCFNCKKETVAIELSGGMHRCKDCRNLNVKFK